MSDQDNQKDNLKAAAEDFSKGSRCEEERRRIKEWFLEGARFMEAELAHPASVHDKKIQDLAKQANEYAQIIAHKEAELLVAQKELEKYKGIYKRKSQQVMRFVQKLEYERERSRGLVSALEYIIEHERYHGINQGRDSEDVAREVLAAYYASAKTEGSSSLLNSFSNEKLNKILGVDWFDDESAKEGEKDE